MFFDDSRETPVRKDPYNDSFCQHSNRQLSALSADGGPGERE